MFCLVSSVCTLSFRRMEVYLHDRGSTCGAVQVWCGMAECQRVISCVDGLDAVSYVVYIDIERSLNKCVRTICCWIRIIFECMV